MIAGSAIPPYLIPALNAIAIGKQLLKIDPTLWNRHENCRLGEVTLYEKWLDFGVRDALSNYKFPVQIVRII